jgi:hypothetical protein
LRPRIDHLESRSLLATTPLVVHPTFEIGPSGGNGGPPSGSYTPAQLQESYGFNVIAFGGVVGNGRGETIAIVDAYNDPNIQTDLDKFDTQFGLPATTVAVLNETGGMSYPATDPTGDWELEESLDVEWAHAMAPGASIMLVEASSANESDLVATVKYAAAHANVVSLSWGGSEFSGETADDPQYFDQAGVAFVASSGDAGAPASWPAASPNVLSVGGTALTLGTGSVWSDEVGWSGSGGGPSAYESQPSFQNGVVTQTSSARATPDVAYDASPSTGFAVYDSFDHGGTSYGWLEVGGTSAGAPQWSALLAIADQGRALSGQPALNSTSPQEVMNVLYKNPAAFHDITSGTSTGGPPYSAGPGYDYVTGMGSPIANLIVGSLVGTSTGWYDRLVLAAPTAETAGTSFSLTVTAQNWSGVTDTGYLGTIYFTSSDVQAGLPASFTFTAADAGTCTFTATLKTVGSQSITATDATTSAIAGTTSGISVSPDPASQLVLSGLPSTTTAGLSRTVTVTAEDPYGNVATGYGGTVRLTSSDTQAGLPADYTFTAADQGGHVFTLTFEAAGTQSVTVTDTASGITATQSGITVQAAVAKTFTLTGFPVDDAAGAANDVTVTAYDAYGNVATGYTGAVSLSSSDPQAILVPSRYTFVAADVGKHSFSVTLETAGTQTITATDTVTSGLTAAELNIAVKPATATTLKVTGFPTSDTAGVAGDVVVTAFDAYGNVATGYTGTVSLTSSDPHAVLPSSFTFPGTTGTHTFSVVLDTAGAQSIIATDTASSSLTGAESSITVQAAAARTLEITDFPAVAMAGVANTVTLTAYDAYGNVATGYTGTISFSSSDEHALLPSGFSFFAADAGTHTFSVTLQTAGTQSITATDTANPSISGTVSGIRVRATPQVTWSPPASIVYGTPLTTAQLDASANVPGTFTYTPAAGAILDAGAGQPLSVTFTPTDATDYTMATGATTIDVTRATPTIVLTAPGGTFDGSPFSAAVTIAGVGGTPGSSLEGVSPSLNFYSGTYSSPTQLAGLTPMPVASVHAGAYSVLVSFPATADYAAATGLANFTIARATPQVTWSPPASIVYGTPLTAAQLDASANVPGTFTYTPAAGAILDAGAGQPLSVTFTPTDATDYTMATGATTIDVTRATPTIVLTAPGGTFDGSPFPAAVTIAGSGHDTTPAASLEHVAPVLTYYIGSGTAGTSLGMTPPVHAGTYTVVATFPGSTDYSAARPTPVTFTIGKETPTIVLASSGGSAVFGQTVTFVATVTAGAATPGGTVAFYDGTTPLGTAPLDAAGKATLATAALTIGWHSITATYGGNADLLAVSSGASTEPVARAATRVVLVPHPAFNQKVVVSLSLEAEVQPIALGAGVPTGTVTFEIRTESGKKVTEKVLGTATVSGGSATLVVKPNRVLKKTIIILYGGDADFTSSTAMSPVLTQRALKSLARPMVALQARGHTRIAAAIVAGRGRRA